MAAAAAAAPAAEAQNASQQFLDDNQYTRNGILRYERIFGDTFVSTGGKRTTEAFCRRLRLGAGTRVLDVGVGTGGSAFYMAREFGCHVTGVDLSRNMVEIAEERRQQLPEQLRARLEFQIADVTEVEYGAGTFDVIYSRDTVLHIADKRRLYASCLRWLRPGGQLLVSDYCQGAGPLSDEFLQYRQQRGYHLLTVKEYGLCLESAGFEDVQAIDNSAYYLEILRDELARFKEQEDDFLRTFSRRDFDDIVAGWEGKIKRVGEGSQVWGLFQARRPLEQ